MSTGANANDADFDFEYRCAKQFYRENEGKAFKLSYDQKLRFIALSKLISRGPYSPEKDQTSLFDGSYFDLVGSDRKSAWQKLGNLAKQDAILAFVSELKEACPTFEPYLKAHVKMEQEKQNKENSCLLDSLPETSIVSPMNGSGDPMSQNFAHPAASNDPNNLQHFQQIEQQKTLIKNALNAQTYQQFKQYAVSRCPDDAKAQETLILELQEQHFQQYMQHVYYQQLAQLRASQTSGESAGAVGGANPAGGVLSFTAENPNQNASGGPEKGDGSSVAASKPRPDSMAKIESEIAKENKNESATTPSDNLLIANPAMWTNANINEFKKLVKKDKNLLVKVGRGEMVTIRVPTLDDGSYLFWEFATDNYDIGFGLYFEWTISPTNEITITAEEPSDDEDDEIVDSGNPHDVEKREQQTSKDNDKPAMDVIVPIYRRDSHVEVQAGSHEYPGQGTYLLKFDNTYSLFRGKSLYYRVYYTK